MIDGKLVVQSNSYGRALSKINLSLDRRSRDIVSKEAEIIDTYHQGMKPDRQITKMIQKYEKQVAPIINRKVGEAADTLTRQQNAHGESALGNLIADAQRWKMETDIAFMNPGGIRHDIAAGDVTWGDLYNVQPFNNDLVTLKLTGDQIRRLLNQQWQEGYTRMLQISGLTYTWDGSKPVGERIVELHKLDGTPIEADAVYTVTVNAFLADGGDNFTVLTKEPTVLSDLSTWMHSLTMSKNCRNPSLHRLRADPTSGRVTFFIHSDFPPANYNGGGFSAFLQIPKFTTYTQNPIVYLINGSFHNMLLL